MYKLPELSYKYDDLEPYIDAQTMELHHSKHHQAYVDKLNAALEGTEWEKQPIEAVLKMLDDLPEEKRTAVRNNGGGHYNHSLFWKFMSPNAGGEPSGILAEKIVHGFGSFDRFKELFSNEAVGRFGSGWVWLTEEADGSLQITSTPNQDSPIMEGVEPLLGLDVWEHAYYLKYQNRRPEYVDNWWSVVNWHVVESRLK